MGKIIKDPDVDGAVDLQKLSDIEHQRISLRIEMYEKHYDISINEVTSLSRWLTASLLAINSGGILSILNQAQHIENIQFCGILFVVGLVFSLLSATANQEIYNRVGDAINDMVMYWKEVRITQQEDQSAHKNIVARIDKLKRLFWIGPLSGWLSGLSFIAGATAVALNLTYAASP